MLPSSADRIPQHYKVYHVKEIILCIIPNVQNLLFHKGTECFYPVHDLKIITTSITENNAFKIRIKVAVRDNLIMYYPRRY